MSAFGSRAGGGRSPLSSGLRPRVLLRPELAAGLARNDWLLASGSLAVDKASTADGCARAGHRRSRLTGGAASEGYEAAHRTTPPPDLDRKRRSRPAARSISYCDKRRFSPRGLRGAGGWASADSVAGMGICARSRARFSVATPAAILPFWQSSSPILASRGLA
jgi:hypothetical protein